MRFFKGGYRLLGQPELRIRQPKVEDGLDVVGLDADGLEVQVFSRVDVPVDEETVAFAYEGLGIVAVANDSGIGELRSLFDVALDETSKREVGAGS